MKGTYWVDNTEINLFPYHELVKWQQRAEQQVLENVQFFKMTACHLDFFDYTNIGFPQM